MKTACPRNFHSLYAMTMRNRHLFLLITAIWIGTALHSTSPTVESSEQKHSDSMALPSSVPEPADNPTTAEKVELGKQLFFDPRLSGDNTMNCASCHLPDKAFADGLSKAKGAGGKLLARNTPSLINAGFHKSYFWDGRASSLEQQAFVPIQSPDEMNQDPDELVKELSAIPGYMTQFKSVFGTAPTRETIAKALAAFQRTLLSRNSPFDRYLAGDKNAISEEARQGWELFRGDAGCIRCHSGPTFSDGGFHRLGVSYADKGRGAITDNKRDINAFRTPSLRDVARTAPYMHDGSQETLFQVVGFYYRSMLFEAPDGTPLDIAPLIDRSFSEVAAIVAFLESLTGESPQVMPPRLP